MQSTQAQDKLTEQNYQLEYQIKVLEEKRERLIAMLERIEQAKAYRLWHAAQRPSETALKVTASLADVLKNFLPLYFRKKLKAKLEKIAMHSLQDNGLDIITLKQWQVWHETRKPHAKDIFVFGITSFDYRIQRPQHLALKLAAKGNRVFYIESEFSPYSTLSKNTPFRVRQHADTNVYIVKLAASQNLFIYHDVPSISDTTIMQKSLKSLIRHARIINPVAKIDHPFWTALVDLLAMPMVYDCMDEHSGFAETSSAIVSQEMTLLAKSDLVIVSSDYLKKKISKKRKKGLIQIKNASEYNHFALACGNTLPKPEQMLGMSGPIIGYYGAIAPWFDDEVLEKLAQDYPNATIVLIGHLHNAKVGKLAKRYRNIRLMGEMPYSILPYYLQQFDVCIIPFIINDLIKATSPVKAFEYFAAGKPIVTTAIPELIPYKDSLYIASSPVQFSQLIAKALAERDPKLPKARQAIALQNTWGERANRLVAQLDQLVFPPVSVVVVAYNNGEYTQKCITSVIERSFYPNLEIILVDNGSDLKSKQIFARLAKHKKVVLLTNKENVGFGMGNNIGMRKAKGNYIVLLNNDTKVTPGWIARLVFHASKPSVGLVGPVTNNIGNEAKISISYDPENNEDLELNALTYTALHWGETLNLDRIAAFCWVQSRKTYKKIGEFDKRFGKAFYEDDDYCMRVKNAGLTILCADDVFVHHYGGGTTGWYSESYKKLMAENRKKFEKKWHTQWVPHKYRDQ